MEFLEYCKRKNPEMLVKTEQSETFVFEENNKKIICKRFQHPKSRQKEEMAQRYLMEKNIIMVPRLTFSGEDFLEMEFIEKLREPSNEEIIRNISNLYKETLDNPPTRLFQTVDLSKEKIFHRLSYLVEEFDKSKVNEEGILMESEVFVKKKYDASPHICLVHGDLKSIHCIPSEKGLFFVDFGLTGIASPWYDLAFLYLEKKDKTGLLEDLAKNAYGYLSEKLKVNEEESLEYLKSGVFYRCLYNLGFALRHRPIKIIERTKKELKEILQTNI
ncbi:MAG: phosphotransferase [archaeon]